MSRVRICRLDELEEGTATKFSFQRAGKIVEGFVVQFKGQIVAYENVCRHIAISLDYGDGKFFTRDGRHLICQTHGAIYEPLSGLCVRGPCEGDRLKRLEITVSNGELWLV